MKNIQYLVYGLIFIVAPALSMAAEVINLEGTFKGNQEQPRVLYIIPWQQVNSEANLERPVDRIIGEIFRPIDRDSFRRELKYFKVLANSEKKAADSPLLE